MLIPHEDLVDVVRMRRLACDGIPEHLEDVQDSAAIARATLPKIGIQPAM
jgi:hypothetical protein